MKELRELLEMWRGRKYGCVFGGGTQQQICADELAAILDEHEDVSWRGLHFASEAYGRMVKADLTAAQARIEKVTQDCDVWRKRAEDCSDKCNALITKEAKAQARIAELEEALGKVESIADKYAFRLYGETRSGGFTAGEHCAAEIKAALQQEGQ